MKIQRTIKVNIETTKDSVIVSDGRTLQMIMGTTSVSGNLHIYGVKRKGNKYIIPKKQLEKRIKDVENRVNDWSAKLEIMKQIIKG